MKKLGTVKKGMTVKRVGIVNKMVTVEEAGNSEEGDDSENTLEQSFFSGKSV